jgi:hypothetical protein
MGLCRYLHQTHRLERHPIVSPRLDGWNRRKCVMADRLTVTPSSHKTEASSRDDARTARTGPQPSTFSSHTLSLQQLSIKETSPTNQHPLARRRKTLTPNYLPACLPFVPHPRSHHQTLSPPSHSHTSSTHFTHPPTHERLTPIHPNQSNTPSTIPAHHIQHASQSSQTHASLPVPLKGSRWIAPALKGSQSPSARKASPGYRVRALSPFR